MNINLEYNPYTIKARIIFNDNAADLRSLQFSQIINFPLQSWLRKRLDWPGLADKLKVVCRGASIDLVFTGRGIDYDDLRIALDGKIANLTLEHVAKYETAQDIDDVFMKTFADYPVIDERQAEYNALRDIIDEINNSSEKFEIVVSDEKDFYENRQEIFNTYYPLFISADIWQAHAAEIERGIAENFSRPYESIFILLNDPKDRNLFLSQTENGIHVGEYDEARAETVRRKYPGSSILKDPERIQAMLKEIFSLLENEYEFVREELLNMRRQSLHESYIDEDSSERYNKFLGWQNWYRKFVKEVKIYE